MNDQIREFSIAQRGDEPETTLRVRVLTKDDSNNTERPFVFILPGGPGANHSFYQAYDCLIEVANVAYYDPRGCGLSDTGPQSSYSMDNYIDDLAHIIQHMDCKETIVLGKSYGAICSLGLALRYPALVDKLIVVAGAPSYHFLETAKKNLSLRGTEDQKRVCEALWNGSVKSDDEADAFFEITASLYSWKVRNSVECPAGKKIKHRFSCESLNEGFSKKFNHFDYRPQLHKIQCPTLVAVGAEDWITDPIHSEEIASGIPDSVYLKFENSDHSVEKDAPEIFFPAIKDFIKG
ncbi:MAG: prolyl aminopeptidase [Legionellales bacterium]|nr:prolyl aminopeptidase [Legionellales bacterium]|tara:strand:- start:517 stop:1395 length:879 start_codon:yes stop_codon:yes gene_type:complete